MIFSKEDLDNLSLIIEEQEKIERNDGEEVLEFIDDFDKFARMIEPSWIP